MILIGRNDASVLSSGWHPVQIGPAGLPCRWMSPRAVVRVQPPPGVRGICLTVSAPAEIRGVKPGLSIYAAGALVGHCADLGEEGAWNTACLTFEEGVATTIYTGTEPAALTLAIESRNGGETTPLAFVPHEVLSNGDLRELGVQVSSLRWITG